MKEKSCYYVFIKVQLLVGFILMPCEEELPAQGRGVIVSKHTASPVLFVVSLLRLPLDAPLKSVSRRP